MEPPKGLVKFDQLELCQPYRRQLQIVTSISVIITILGLVPCLLYGISPALVLMAVVFSGSILWFFGPDLISVINTPLAVNLNHPFFTETPAGKASVFVQFSNDEWQELGPHRVRLIDDEMVGGFSLVEDDDEYKFIGHYSKAKNKNWVMKQVIIINQALSLRDGVNGHPDPIENARARESLDYGLLDRAWLEEEEIAVEGPLAKLINKE